MKFLTISLVLFLGSSSAFAQKLLSVQNSICAPISISVRAHDAVSTCANIGVNGTVGLGIGTTYIGDLTAFDDMSCLGTGPGWHDTTPSPICANLGSGPSDWDWDLITVNVGGVFFPVTYSGSCMSGTFNNTATNTTSCGSVTVDFVVDGSGNYQINVY